MMRRPHTLLAAICTLHLLASGCASRTAKTLDPRTDIADRGIQPASLSDYIRGVYKLSSEAANEAEERALLLKAAPDLQSLIEHVEANPGDGDARGKLVTEFMSRQLYWSAYTLLTNSLPAANNDPDTNLNLAIIWDAWAQYDLALQHAERAFTNGAASTRALETLGRVHLHRNELDEAVAWYDRALQDERTAPVFANLGYIYMLKQDWERAKAHLEEALVLDSHLEQARNNLAFVLSKTGDLPGALEQLLQAGRPAVAYNNIGVLYLDQNNSQEAQHYFQEALRLEPDYEIARTNLSVLDAALPPPSIIRLPSATQTSPGKPVSVGFLERIPLTPVRPAMLQSSHEPVPAERAVVVKPEIKNQVSSLTPAIDNFGRLEMVAVTLPQQHVVEQKDADQRFGVAGLAGLMVVLTGLFALRSRRDRSAARRQSNS